MQKKSITDFKPKSDKGRLRKETHAPQGAIAEVVNQDIAHLEREVSRVEQPPPVPEVVDSTIIFMNPAEVQISEDFQIFLPASGLGDAIREDMAKNGYDSAQPLSCANGPWTQVPILFDGHTRREKAIDLEIPRVPVVIHTFETIDDVYSRMLYLQGHRRHWTDATLFQTVEKVNELKARGPKKIASADAKYGKSSKELAKLCGTSSTKIERIRYILKRMAPDGPIRQQIIDGDYTIHQAWEIVHNKCNIKPCKAGNEPKNGDAQKEAVKTTQIGNGRGRADSTSSRTPREPTKNPDHGTTALGNSAGKSTDWTADVVKRVQWDNTKSFLTVQAHDFSTQQKKRLQEAIFRVLSEFIGAA
jgi:hypothetical protein